jgi:hypothetical protein
VSYIVIRVYSFECDVCGELEDATPLPGQAPLSRARQEVAARGWKYVDSRDLCRRCAATGDTGDDR